MKKAYRIIFLIILILITGCKKDKDRNKEILLNPEITAKDGVVIEYNDFKVTNNELYEVMKLNYGLSTIINIIDRDIFSGYEDKVNQEEINAFINYEKDYYKDLYDYHLLTQGVITSETDELKEAKIKDYYILRFLYIAYANEKALAEGSELTDEYVKTKVKELRKASDIKIYDTMLSKQYQNEFVEDYQLEEKLLDDKTVIATYKINDEVKYLTTDFLYKEMKIKYGYFMLIDIINLKALQTISGIQITSTELEENVKIVNDNKAQKPNEAIGLTWEQFLNKKYGVINENHLVDLLSASTLIRRYLLGYDDFSGVSAIGEQDIADKYQEWFMVSAYHILFSFAENDEEEKELALTKANQVLYGCQEDETCYIYRDDTSPYIGLINEEDIITAIKVMASKYSDDPSASINNGYLGYFAKGDMIKKFDEKIQEIVNNPSSPFGITEFTEYGYHVIYVDDIEEKVSLEAYREYMNDLENDLDITGKYSAEEIAEFDNYQVLENQFIKALEQEKLSFKNQSKQLAKLRDSLNIAYFDNDLQNIYVKVTEMEINF